MSLKIYLLKLKEDTVLKLVTRNEIRTKGLRHRGTAILVFNANGELFIHKRTSTKDVFPGYYDIAVGGVVESGETYETSAKRELAEEVGITGVDLEFLFKMQYESPTHKTIAAIYSCVYDGPITLQEEEIEEGFFLDLEQAKKFVVQQKICPDSCVVFKRFLEHISDRS